MRYLFHMVVLFLLLMSVTIFVIIVGYLYMVRNGAPYLGTQNNITNQIVAFAEMQPNEKVIDIGSGDGRVVGEFAEHGCKAYGIELNPLLVWISLARLRKKDNATILLGDIWAHNYAPYDVVYVYGMPHLMKRLQTKLRSELKPGAKVITNAFQFPDWSVAKQRGRLRLYKQP